MIEKVTQCWTDAQVNYLTEHYPVGNTRQIAKDIGKSFASIQIKAQRLGLRKDLKNQVKTGKSLLMPWERVIASGVISKQGNVTVHRMI